jgi:hypothetical protein
VKNKMSDLRNHLFETIEALKDDEKPMELGRAKAIGEVAQVIINSAKVEIEFMEAVGATPAGELFNGAGEALPLHAPRPVREIGPGRTAA